MEAQSSLFDILLDHLSELKLEGTADLLLIGDNLPSLLHDDGTVQLIPGTAPILRENLSEEVLKQWGLKPELNHPYDVSYDHNGVSYHVLIHNGSELFSASFHQGEPVQSKPVRSLRNVKPKSTTQKKDTH